MNAIIYTTNTGSTRHYAKLLGRETGLPVYSSAEAKKTLSAGASVIYLGWIMAGSVKGYAAAARRYRIEAVCGVGMGRTGTQEDSVRQKTMMEIMVKTAGKALAEKTDRTPEEDDMLDMMRHGSERVKPENLKAVLDWYGARK